MASPELVASLARTLRHLAAARFYLAEALPAGESSDAEAELLSYLHHREYGLALEVAESLGSFVQAPAEYWRELQLAAENMGNIEAARRCGARVNA